MAQFTERFRLNLTDTLSCNVELFTNLFEGSRTAVIESETETQNLLLTVSQSETGSWEIFRISRTRSTDMCISSAISSGVGSRPNSCSN